MINLKGRCVLIGPDGNRFIVHIENFTLGPSYNFRDANSMSKMTPGSTPPVAMNLKLEGHLVDGADEYLQVWCCSLRPFSQLCLM